MIKNSNSARNLLKHFNHYSLQIIFWIEISTLIFLVFVLWLDELLDLPHLLLVAQKTPVNWQEALLERLLVAIIGGLMVWSTHFLLKKADILRVF